MSDLFEAIDATWRAAGTEKSGPFILREGQGGGQRVSAATTETLPSEAEVEAAEDAMLRMGQQRLFRVRGDQAEFDKRLADMGYVEHDPVVVLLASIEVASATPPDPVSAFPIWPPLAIMREIWDDGDIGPERRRIMDNVTAPKTAMLGRTNDRAAGCAFVAVHKGIGMIHAVHVLPELRRRGAALNMARGAAHWARRNGATHFATLTTRENAASQAVFASLGLTAVEQYHYRLNPNPTGRP